LPRSPLFDDRRSPSARDHRDNDDEEDDPDDADGNPHRIVPPGATTTPFVDVDVDVHLARGVGLLLSRFDDGSATNGRPVRGWQR